MMSKSDPNEAPTIRARERRSSGTVTDFDGKRLSLARRMSRRPRTALATEVHVSPAAITQFERGDARPTKTTVAELALALGVPAEFFLLGRPIEQVPSTSAHFRSLRATPAISRDQALAFAEVSLAVIDMLEQYVDFPQVNIPLHPLSEAATPDEIADAAALTRAELNVGDGPVPHMVRLLEANGIVALRLPQSIDQRVDAFSSQAGSRPLVLLSLAKADRARSRFDSAHELGHLVMHPDEEPGSKAIESAAHRFAAAFLAPIDELVEDLPKRVDWDALQEAKKKWGVSLSALVYRAHDIGLWGDATYRRAMQHLSAQGYPEPGSLGPPESPYVLGAAFDLLTESGIDMEALSKLSRLPASIIAEIVQAGREDRPKLQVLL
ncbi:MAG TPA: XRE family transcriptional regulator [Galbitalea sp.]|jgi:Zn-dependent peptidase ImmA (M78 family)/DNA-binding XRE family transcriptional regulator|nr:XRE family transcriptional regulator [Galbitalea sp.]